MYIPPPMLLAIAIGASYTVSSLFPALSLAIAPFPWLGIALLLLGIISVSWAAHTLARHKTTLHPRGKPTKLVTRGPYTYSRNPIYLGLLLIAIGSALLFANVLAFVGPALFFLFTNSFIIPMEESILTTVFGASYKTYRKTTHRWL